METFHLFCHTSGMSAEELVDNDALIRERVQTLFLRYRISLPGAALLILLLLAAYRQADEVQLLAWLTVSGVFMLLQWLCIHAFFRDTSQLHIIRWARGLLCSSSMLGFVIGSSTWLFMDLNDMTNVVLITLVLLGTMFGSAVFASVYFPIHALWCATIGIPLSLYFIYANQEDYIILGFVIVFAAIPSALILGWILTQEYRRSQKLRQKNIQLIRELSQEKEQIELLSKDKSRFLTAISHDLRQPLHALDLFHASMKLRLKQEDVRPLLERASDSSRALAEMLGELMDIARLDAGKMTAKRKIVPLMPILTECVAEQRSVAEDKGLSLRLHRPRKGCVNTDPVLFKRILRNLLSNAIRHTESGGVLVGTRIRGSKIRIEVYDTGSGISDEVLLHIFDEFYQGDNPERDREKGLGLGLAIVRRVAELLGHRVSVRSHPRSGSCFAIELPLCVNTDMCDAPILAKHDANEDDFTGLFVIVVDDDQMILQGMRGLLLDWGCEVLLAESEDMLLAELSAHDYPIPNILICDYRLRHGRTGLQLVAAVRAHFGKPELPTTIISGDVHPEVQERVKAAHCQWQEKPMPEIELRRLLKSVAD